MTNQSLAHAQPDLQWDAKASVRPSQIMGQVTYLQLLHASNCNPSQPPREIVLKPADIGLRRSVLVAS